MNEAGARRALLARPEAYEDFPFGPEIRVFKVRERMFATLGRIPGAGAVGMNLKCDPQQALILREQFASVIPGYHMNKTHWNTVLLDGSVPEQEILWMIDHSYARVVWALPRAARTSLEIAHGREALYRDRPGFSKY